MIGRGANKWQAERDSLEAARGLKEQLDQARSELEQAKREGAGKSPLVPFILVFIANLIMAVMLYGIMRHVGPFTVRSGMISGALIWFGFVITAMASNYAFQGRKPMLTVIDGGYWLAVLLVIGAILGAFGG